MSLLSRLPDKLGLAITNRRPHFPARLAPLTSGGSASDRAPLPIPGLLVMALGLVLVAGGSAALLRRR